MGGVGLHIQPLSSIIAALMSDDPLKIFDPDLYLRTPRQSTEGTLALGRALLESRPEKLPGYAQSALERLERVVTKGEEMLIERRRMMEPMDNSRAMALDAGVDALWGAIRDRLMSWSVFGHPALEEIAKEKGKRSAIAVQLGQAKAKAERAEWLLGRLFGNDGLAFLRLPYPEQSESMKAILSMVEQDDLTEEIESLTGPELLRAIKAYQVEYEAMVQERYSKAAQKPADLGKLRNELQSAIKLYSMAMVTLGNDGGPGVVELVQGALRPIMVTRARPSASGGRSVEVEEDAEETMDPPRGTPSEGTP